MTFFNWLHHLFNPHCPFCEIKATCESCETLRQQLARVSNENEKLLNTIIELTKPVQITQEKEEKTEELKSKFVPWSTKRMELERNDRITAQINQTRLEEIKRNQKVDVSDLEAEMDIIAKEKQNAITQ